MQSVYPDRHIAGRVVPPIGFGSMLLANEGRPGEAEAIAVLHAAFDAGVRVVDTAINYCANGSEFGYNEALVARALSSWSGDADDVLIVGKGGNLRTDSEPFIQDGRPANLRWSCELTLRALGVESIGLYILHSIDPAVPLAESIGALSGLRDEGKIRHIGISNAGRRQIAEAQAVTRISAVENRLSPWSINALPIVEFCEQQGISFLAYSPLGGRARAARLADDKPSFGAIAKERGVSPQQVALAWALTYSPVILPIPSARRLATLIDSVGAAGLALTDAERQRLARDLGSD